MAPPTATEKTKATGDLQEISAMTPFKEKDLKGTRFARGNMLGGSHALESATSANWKR